MGVLFVVGAIPRVFGPFLFVAPGRNGGANVVPGFRPDLGEMDDTPW